MRADADRLAVLQHDNPIRMADGRGALGDNKNRRLLRQLTQGAAQPRLGRIVQCRRAVVQNQNIRAMVRRCR